MAKKPATKPLTPDMLDWMQSSIAQQSGAAFDHLLRVQMVVRDLGRALARGENVADEIDELYERATGHQEMTNARLSLIASVKSVANHSDADWARTLGSYDKTKHVPAVVPTDEELADQVIGCLRRPPHRLDAAAGRLHKQSTAVALAVRLWRGKRGRRKTGSPKGSKWRALSDLMLLAGFGGRGSDEKALENIWLDHGYK